MGSTNQKGFHFFSHRETGTVHLIFSHDGDLGFEALGEGP